MFFIRALSYKFEVFVVCLQLQEKNASLQRDFVELKERLEILEVQLAVNKEDFENERRDRERAQNLLSELQRHVEMLNPNAVRRINFHPPYIVRPPSMY